MRTFLLVTKSQRRPGVPGIWELAYWEVLRGEIGILTNEDIASVGDLSKVQRSRVLSVSSGDAHTGTWNWMLVNFTAIGINYTAMDLPSASFLAWS